MNSEPDEAPLASPCRRQCCLDERDQCLGCGRNLREILDWDAADNARRRAICEAAQRRMQQRRQSH